MSDEVSDSGLQPLRDAGFLDQKKTGLSLDQLHEELADSEGLIVRRLRSRGLSRRVVLRPTCNRDDEQESSQR